MCLIQAHSAVIFQPMLGDFRNYPDWFLRTGQMEQNVLHQHQVRMNAWRQKSSCGMRQKDRHVHRNLHSIVWQKNCSTAFRKWSQGCPPHLAECQWSLPPIHSWEQTARGNWCSDCTSMWLFSIGQSRLGNSARDLLLRWNPFLGTGNNIVLRFLGHLICAQGARSIGGQWLLPWASLANPGPFSLVPLICKWTLWIPGPLQSMLRGNAKCRIQSRNFNIDCRG